MNKRIYIAIAAIAASVLVGVVSFYIYNFGTKLSNSQEQWGQFGDYFGGILNPSFSALAFFALLWSISLQDREFKKTSEHLTEQAENSAREFQRISNERIAQELMHVMRDIDTRIEKIFQEVISPPEASHQLTIALMNAEAERLALHNGHSQAYQEFLSLARERGSIIEAKTREIIYLISKMRVFLEQYAGAMSGAYTPTICYYADKTSQILYLAEDIGGLPADTRSFFASIADKHG